MVASTSWKSEKKTSKKLENRLVFWHLYSVIFPSSVLTPVCDFVLSVAVRVTALTSMLESERAEHQQLQLTCLMLIIWITCSRLTFKVTGRVLTNFHAQKLQSLLQGLLVQVSPAVLFGKDKSTIKYRKITGNSRVIVILVAPLNRHWGWTDILHLLLNCGFIRLLKLLISSLVCNFFSFITFYRVYLTLSFHPLSYFLLKSCFICLESFIGNTYLCAAVCFRKVQNVR